MTSNKLAAIAGGLVFLVLALIALYRLLVGFPISIGGMQIGQTTSFFAFVIFAVLSLIMFRGLRADV